MFPAYFETVANGILRLAGAADSDAVREHGLAQSQRFRDLAELAREDATAARIEYRPARAYEPVAAQRQQARGPAPTARYWRAAHTTADGVRCVVEPTDVCRRPHRRSGVERVPRRPPILGLVQHGPAARR